MYRESVLIRTKGCIPSDDAIIVGKQREGDPSAVGCASIVPSVQIDINVVVDDGVRTVCH
jgi:hypothetical protein